MICYSYIKKKNICFATSTMIKIQKDIHLTILTNVVLIAIELTVAGNNFLESISICLCFENLICFVGGSILVI